MNRAAYDVFDAARRAYLVANGWVEVGPDTWREPEGERGGGRRRRGRELTLGHAVNSQLYSDRGALEAEAFVPPTLEEQRARALWLIREEWPRRRVATTFGSYRQSIRGHVRRYARLLGEEGAVTRVQKARLQRALHAKHHRERDCACGKKGPPY